jgi:sugar-specific transcriptional regulator TrmB
MNQEIIKQGIRSLSELGFTELEAMVYAYLVENSPATPYRVAQEIGKPVANTYKAVKSLSQKGALLIDGTKNQQCQAIPPDELLGKIKQSFLMRHQTAASTLSHLKPSGNHEKIFALETTEQVFDRCRKLIEQAENVILVDAFPQTIEILQPWLETAAQRKIPTIAQVYKPTKIKGVEIVNSHVAKLMLRRWQGQWLILVVDAAEYLFAYLTADGLSVQKAIWCGSVFLSGPQHFNLALAFQFSVIEELIKKGAPHDKLLQTLKRTEKWQLMGERGYSKLTSEFGQELF